MRLGDETDDGDGELTATQDITVTVNAVNDAPEAFDVIDQTNEDEPINIFTIEAIKIKQLSNNAFSMSRFFRNSPPVIANKCPKPE